MPYRKRKRYDPKKYATCPICHGRVSEYVLGWHLKKWHDDPNDRPMALEAEQGAVIDVLRPEGDDAWRYVCLIPGCGYVSIPVTDTRGELVRRIHRHRHKVGRAGTRTLERT